MKFLYSLIWLFPILFMIQDFEEIIMVNPWKKKNKDYIESMKKENKYVPYPFDGSTASFSIGVLIEFIIISLVTILSYAFDNYLVWIGLFIGFTVHLFVHVGLSIYFKKYVPGIITSIILIPICIFLLYTSDILSMFTPFDLLVSIIIAVLIVMSAIYILHKLINLFNLWLGNYSCR